MSHSIDLLPIATALLAVIGTLLLGMAQPDYSLPPLMVAVAVTSVFFTDFKRWFRLNRSAASIAALAAAGLAMHDYFAQLPGNRELVAIARLLVYLQVVLLFQEKTARVYWQLLMMSLLQVVVAAVLSLSILFGVLLVAYVVVALAAMLLFFLSREMQRYRVAAPLGLSPSGLGIEQQGHDVGPTAPWPLGEASLRFTAFDTSRATQKIADWGVLQTLVKMALATLGVTALLFFAVPRIGGTPWRGKSSSPPRVVGFSESIQLGELGSVADDPQRVMRVKFVDLQSGEPFQVSGEFLLRGSVVTNYNLQNSGWSQSEWSHENETVDLPTALDEAGLVSQEITLEPLNEPVVFSVYPAYRLDSSLIARFDPNRQQLIRPEEYRDSPVSLRIGTSGFRRRWQLLSTPQDEPLRLASLWRDGQLIAPFNKEGVPAQLRGLADLADQTLRAAGVSPKQRVRAAHTLEAFLRSPRFTYSLEPSRHPRQAQDPIEDFVLYRRRGHCEYFASALALMLRSQRIPARVVIGFKDGDWNSIGQFYDVRQLHAHSWVEAYLEPEGAEAIEELLGSSGAGGSWLRLDPTPGEQDIRLTANVGAMTRIRELFACAELLWTNYVVGLNQERQQDSIYGPLARTVIHTVQGVFGVSTWTSSAMSVWTTARNAVWSWLQGNWFSWRGGLVAMVISLLLVGIFHVARWLGRVALRWYERRGRSTSRRDGFGVRFYSRLETILRRHGISRPAHVTPHEFANKVGDLLHTASGSQSTTQLLHQIVDAFYRVRFGGHDLEKHEADAVERALAEVEGAMRKW